jgi:hypothetical protein
MNRETRRDPTPRIGRKDLQDPDRDVRPVQIMTNTTKRFTVLTGTALLIGASVSRRNGS